MLIIKKTILVVDDDEDMQIYINKILSNLGYEVLLSNNSEDAFAMVLDHCPHLILLDVNLKGEYGFDLLEKMDQVDLTSKINIFMISTETSKQAIALSKNFNVQGYLLKPLNNNTLINTVKKYVKEYSFPPLEFSDKEDQQSVKLKIPVEVIKINEVSLTLRSKVKFSDIQKVEIESNFLSELGVKTGHYRVYQQSRDINPGIYDTIIQLLGLSERTLQNIRKVQTKKV